MPTYDLSEMQRLMNQINEEQTIRYRQAYTQLRRPLVNWGPVQYQDDDYNSSAAYDKSRKAQEKQALTQFINEGFSDLSMRLMPGDGLAVFGFDLNNEYSTPLLFTISDKMRVWKSRTSHIRSMLNKLAEREGLEVELLSHQQEHDDDWPAVPHWVFNNPPAINDSKLVAQAQLRENAPEVYDDDEDLVFVRASDWAYGTSSTIPTEVPF